MKTVAGRDRRQTSVSASVRMPVHPLDVAELVDCEELDRPGDVRQSMCPERAERYARGAYLGERIGYQDLWPEAPAKVLHS